MNRAVISVGSNIDPETNVARARELVEGRFELLGVSSFERTEPLGYTDQADFLNGAFLVATPLSRGELEKELKRIEAELGRVRTVNRYGPRTIDLDVVVFNGEVVDSDFHEREFVRRACRELLGDSHDPAENDR